jgi:hypothetical protein
MLASTLLSIDELFNPLLESLEASDTSLCLAVGWASAGGTLAIRSLRTELQTP